MKKSKLAGCGRESVLKRIGSKKTSTAVWTRGASISTVVTWASERSSRVGVFNIFPFKHQRSRALCRAGLWGQTYVFMQSEHLISKGVELKLHFCCIICSVFCLTPKIINRQIWYGLAMHGHIYCKWLRKSGVCLLKSDSVTRIVENCFKEHIIQGKMKSSGSNEEWKSGEGTSLFTATEFCSREKYVRLHILHALLSCLLDWMYTWYHRFKSKCYLHITKH